MIRRTINIGPIYFWLICLCASQFAWPQTLKAAALDDGLIHKFYEDSDAIQLSRDPTTIRTYLLAAMEDGFSAEINESIYANDRLIGQQRRTLTKEQTLQNVEKDLTTTTVVSAKTTVTSITYADDRLSATVSATSLATGQTVVPGKDGAQIPVSFASGMACIDTVDLGNEGVRISRSVCNHQLKLTKG